MKMECFLKIKPHNSVRNRTVNFRGNNLIHGHERTGSMEKGKTKKIWIKKKKLEEYLFY